MDSEYDDLKQSEYEKSKKSRYELMRSLMDYGMGLLYLGVGVLFAFHAELELNFLAHMPGAFGKIFGGICGFYGAWRIYRGYARNYYKNN